MYWSSPPQKKKLKIFYLVYLSPCGQQTIYSATLALFKTWNVGQESPNKICTILRKLQILRKIIKFVDNVKSGERGGRESPNKICELCEILWKLRQIIKFANNVKSSERDGQESRNKNLQILQKLQIWWKLQKIVKLCVNNLISGKRGVQEGSNKTCKLCENCKKIQNLSTK